MADEQQTYSLETISKLLMLSERRCQQLVSDGIIPKHPRGEYDLVQSVQGYVKFLREKAFGGVANTDQHIEKTRLVSAQANIAEMNDAELRGDLVRTDDVRRTIFSAARSVRNSVQTIADRVSMPIAGMSDQHDIHELIDAEVMQVLGDMDDAWRALLPEVELGDERDTDNAS
jgi:phage terminase Nu1 subunit (DNA packaging protein)